MKSRILKKQWKKMTLLEAFFDDEIVPIDINKAMFIWEINPVNSKKRIIRTAKEYKRLRNYMKKIKIRKDTKAIKKVIAFSNKWEYRFEYMLFQQRKKPNFMRYSQYKCFIPVGNTEISEQGVKIVNIDRETGKIVKKSCNIPGLSESDMKEIVKIKLKELEAGIKDKK